MRLSAWCAAGLFALPFGAAAAEGCPGEAQRLAFRLGSFAVTTASGLPAGRSTVTAILEGCALQEEWEGAISGRGRGITAYDKRDGQWHFFYVSDSGDQLRLAGGFVGDALLLSGPGHAFDGRAGLHRMIWSPLPDGRVRQLWTFSTDGGRRWVQVLDGHHRRKAPSEPADPKSGN
jgi:hypothetical protein